VGTIVTFKSIRFIINSKDHDPPHVHVVHPDAKVRINLETFEPMDDTAFSAPALREIIEKVKEHKEELLDEWRRFNENQRI
jgi:1-acyl-sn-glycerol-3-phosphate acyltransferase